MLEKAEDHAGLMYVYIALGYGVANARGRMGDWAQAAEAAVRHARAAGVYWGDTFGLATALAWGPTPAEDALQTLGELGATAGDLNRAYLLGVLGRSEEARALALAAAERYEQSGDHRHYAFLADLAALEGDYETAVSYGTLDVEAWKAADHLAFAASYGAKLGRWLCLAGCPDEAQPLVDLARTVEGQESEWLWRQVSARVLAHRGEHEEAGALAREAIGVLERTDGPTWQGDGYLDLADVLTAAGRIDEAVEAYEKRSNATSASRISRWSLRYGRGSKRRAASRTALSAREDRPPDVRPQRRGPRERRILLRAPVDRDRAARVEAAAGRDVHGVGRLSLQDLRPLPVAGSRRGTTESSAFVYGCCGFRTTAAAGPSSTMRPRYMTAIRCAKRAAVDRSCVIIRIARPF